MPANSAAIRSVFSLYSNATDESASYEACCQEATSIVSARLAF